MRIVVFVIALLVLYFSFLPLSFAADVTVEGKLVDQHNNPIPQGSVVFIDTAGKTVAAAVSDFSGKYKTAIATGTYTVVIKGPNGSNLEKTLPDHRIEQAVSLDFTFDVPKITEAKKPSLFQQYIPWVGGVLVLGIGIAMFVFWKKGLFLPQSRSSN